MKLRENERSATTKDQEIYTRRFKLKAKYTKVDKLVANDRILELKNRKGKINPDITAGKTKLHKEVL